MASDVFIFIVRWAACYCLKGEVTLKETRLILSYHEWKDRKKKERFQAKRRKHKARNRSFEWF